MAIYIHIHNVILLSDVESFLFVSLLFRGVPKQYMFVKFEFVYFVLNDSLMYILY